MRPNKNPGCNPCTFFFANSGEEGRASLLQEFTVLR